MVAEGQIREGFVGDEKVSSTRNSLITQYSISSIRRSKNDFKLFDLNIPKCTIK